jgi:hypothetical protein
MISGPVGISSDITSKSGFFTSLVNAREPKKFLLTSTPASLDVYASHKGCTDLNDKRNHFHSDVAELYYALNYGRLLIFVDPYADNNIILPLVCFWFE